MDAFFGVITILGSIVWGYWGYEYIRFNKLPDKFFVVFMFIYISTTVLVSGLEFF